MFKSTFFKRMFVRFFFCAVLVKYIDLCHTSLIGGDPRNQAEAGCISLKGRNTGPYGILEAVVI